MSRPFFTPDAATPAGRVFYLAVMPLALLCAGLELGRVHGGIVTNYGADLFGTAWVYSVIRLKRTDSHPWRWAASPISLALAIFAVGTASEYAQRLHLISGTYDPADILTFGVALVACVALERLVGPLRKRDTHTSSHFREEV